jgi:CRISPR-associated protein Cas1
VNALLGFGYSLLAKDCTGAGIRVGLDPIAVLSYHEVRKAFPCARYHGDIPAAVVDSVVLSAINNGVFKEKDFYIFQDVCYLNEKGRKKFLAQYEMRKKDLVTHPGFHYRLTYERTIELQFRLLGKYLLKDIDKYEGFQIR